MNGRISGRGCIYTVVLRLCVNSDDSSHFCNFALFWVFKEDVKLVDRSGYFLLCGILSFSLFSLQAIYLQKTMLTILMLFCLVLAILLAVVAKTGFLRKGLMDWLTRTAKESESFKCLNGDLISVYFSPCSFPDGGVKQDEIFAVFCSTNETRKCFLYFLVSTIICLLLC